MKHPLTLIALALLSAAVVAQPAATVAPKDDAPIVKLPPMKPINVQKYDAEAVKLKSHPYHVTLVKAPEAWAVNPAARGKGVKVAVLDTWAQPDHAMYAHLVKGQYDAITKKANPPRPASPHDHGTHVAGIVARLLPECDLYLITVLDSTGSGSVANIAHGLDYATTEFGVDVSNLSLGGPTADTFLPPAIRRAVAAGNVVVCAAGNDGGNATTDTEGYPARYADAVSVAACDDGRRLAPFSSWGPNVFTTNPGVDVESSLADGRMGEMDGTSMACPVEAGKAGSWVASNRVPRDGGRLKAYREAVLKASPFGTRNNARGYGLYTLDKITGEPASTPQPKPTPGEKVYAIDLVRLKAEGYTSVRIVGVGGPFAESSPATQPIPVASLPQYQPSPVVTYHQPQTVPAWSYQPAPVYAPPPVVYYHPTPSCGPGGCPGGQCQPQPLFRRVWR